MSWCLDAVIMDPGLVFPQFPHQLFTIYQLFQRQLFTKLQSLSVGGSLQPRPWILILL